MKNKGFTLIELMITVAIIGILAAVATGKFSDLISKSKEGRVKNYLGTLRSAISVYYSDTSSYPGELTTALTDGEKYLASIPVMEIPAISAQSNPGHAAGNAVAVVTDDGLTGNWGYTLTAAQEALVFVNCTHNDSRGSVWSSH
jgi:prepilin-type N-terminal cleavage/methylation domain-containing protein